MHIVSSVGDVELGPGVLTAEHEVADGRGRGVVAQGDDDSGRDTGRFEEQLAVAVEVSGTAGEPLVDRLEPPVLPGRLGVVGGGGTEDEALVWSGRSSTEAKLGLGASVARTSVMTAPMSRSRANRPWSCAWSAI